MNVWLAIDVTDGSQALWGTWGTDISQDQDAESQTLLATRICAANSQIYSVVACLPIPEEGPQAETLYPTSNCCLSQRREAPSTVCLSACTNGTYHNHPYMEGWYRVFTTTWSPPTRQESPARYMLLWNPHSKQWPTWVTQIAASQRLQKNSEQDSYGCLLPQGRTWTSLPMISLPDH